MHSPIGLAVTGLVEIIASTVTSLSVCALVGFKVTLVPWELLPLILFFVGAENMISLVCIIILTFSFVFALISITPRPRPWSKLPSLCP